MVTKDFFEDFKKVVFKENISEKTNTKIKITLCGYSDNKIFLEYHIEDLKNEDFQIFREEYDDCFVNARYLINLENPVLYKTNPFNNDYYSVIDKSKLDIINKNYKLSKLK